ncbi:hypothetical protein MUO93_04755, partial [Candidatus Bathyarchaeota archaeon]|nr:hypothetical protein [Candidatus Bathyarchaeota archaeon]
EGCWNAVQPRSQEVGAGMSWIWHGFNLDPEKRRKQCYYNWHCLVCWLRTLFAVLKLRWR